MATSYFSNRIYQTLCVVFISTALSGCDLEKIIIGQGVLTTNPVSTISCETPSSTCTAFDEDSIVIVTATPDLDWAFAGWDGTCLETEPEHSENCSVLMDDHKSVTAKFVPITPGSFTPGQWYFGRNSYVQYRAGNMPLILVVAHGGKQAPEEIPDRVDNGSSTFNTNNDTNSRVLADALAAKMFEYSGLYPHIIVNNLLRIKLDANRGVDEAALGDPSAQRAWREFHTFIHMSKKESDQQFGYGLVADLHGYTAANSSEADPVHLGYLISGAQLLLDPAQPENTITDEMFDLDLSYAENSSIRHLHERTTHSFSSLLRGNFSLGGVFDFAQMSAIPSPSTPHTAPGVAFLGGGFIVDNHGSRYMGTVDAVQLEFPIHLRQTTSVASDTGETAAAILYNFLLTHYPF